MLVFVSNKYQILSEVRGTRNYGRSGNEHIGRGIFLLDSTNRVRMDLQQLITLCLYVVITMYVTTVIKVRTPFHSAFEVIPVYQ